MNDNAEHRNYPSGTSQILAALSRFVRFDAAPKYIDKSAPWLGGLSPREYAAEHGIEALVARVDELRAEIGGDYRG